MELLENSIQPYAWGSHHAISKLLGRATPSARPEAELWLGAHPLAPSRVQRGGVWQPLDELINASPEHELGARSLSEFGPRLPFLMKVLAAEQPLSLQAHPSLEQARAGFAREEARGIARDAPSRSYRDANHKPELISALTGFHALCGFRAAPQSLNLFERLAVPGLEFVLQGLAQGDPGLRSVFERLMTLDAVLREQLVTETLRRCKTLAGANGEFADECRWAGRLGALYPGDAGVISALLLNLVVLEPGDALFLPAGNLHAYLSGVGIEIMANSDNVLRGGLTPKHVDVAELCSVLEFRSGDVPVLRPVHVGSEGVYQTPAPEFRLSTLSASAQCSVMGPEILLCTEGGFVLERSGEKLELGGGQSVFVSAADAEYSVTGGGRLFRATLGG